MLRFVKAIALLFPAVALAQPTSGSAFSATIGLQRDGRIARALADVSPQRIRETDSMLVSFATRHTKPLVNVVNVLAWLRGRDTSRVVVIGGHYDSCVCNVDRFEVTADAPGADDDGSGTAAVIELARVMSAHFPNGLEATVIFALYSGEELGLLGSTHLAKRLHDAGYRVSAAMTDDIVGNVVADDGSTDSTTVRIFAAPPDNGPSRELGRYVWALGRLYTPNFAVLPVWRLDRIGRGGDHSPFVRLGDAGLRFTEKLENYKRQHEILVRPTYAATHEHVIQAGRGTTALVDVQLDDVWVAARSVGAGGARSIATVISTPGGT